MKTVSLISPQIKIIKFLNKHLWWMAPIIIVLPLATLSGNAIQPTAAYIGVSGTWNLIEKFLDQL